MIANFACSTGGVTTGTVVWASWSNTSFCRSNFDKEILNFVQVCPKEMLDKLKHPITTKSTIKKVS